MWFVEPWNNLRDLKNLLECVYTSVLYLEIENGNFWGEQKLEYQEKKILYQEREHTYKLTGFQPQPSSHTVSHTCAL